MGSIKCYWCGSSHTNVMMIHTLSGDRFICDSCLIRIKSAELNKDSCTVANMEIGVTYRVTVPSHHGEFRCGDHIRLLPDGTLECDEAAGWIPSENVSDATIGMKIRKEVKVK